MSTVTKSRKPESLTGVWDVAFRIQGSTGLCWGRKVHEVRRDDESHEDYDARTVMQRVRYDDDGNLAISADGIKRAILTGATRLNMKVPGGGGKATFKARLMAALLIIQEDFTVFRNGKPLTEGDISIEPLYVPSDPSKPKGGRVTRRFPKLYGSWEAYCRYLLTDEKVDEDVLVKHIRAAGLFDGIGTFRVGNGGSHGLFSLAQNSDGGPDITITAYGGA